LENTIENRIEIRNKESRTAFIGISMGESGSVETGIAMLDKDLNLVRVDKSFNLSDLKSNLAHIAPPDNTIACISMPRNMMMLNGKWRIESKHTKPFTLGSYDSKKHLWTQRYSDRGSEFCKTLQDEGAEVFRYNSEFTKNFLSFNPPFKSRSPAACKYLQMVIEKDLGIRGMPSNLIPLPAMNAILGAYTSWKLAFGEENTDYKQISSHKGMPLIAVISK